MAGMSRPWVEEWNPLGLVITHVHNGGGIGKEVK